MATTKTKMKTKTARGTIVRVDEGVREYEQYEQYEHFTIKRSEWLRGRGREASYLLESTTGLKCCVGFFGEQVCGLGAGFLSDEATLEWAVRNVLPWNLRMEFNNALLFNKIYDTNDTDTIDDATREMNLTEQFHELGYHPVFVD